MADGSDQKLEGAIPQLAGMIFSGQPVSHFLEQVVEVSVAALADVEAASVSLRTPRRVRFETINATSEEVEAADGVQYATLKGPCVEAIQTGVEVVSELPNERWPEFSESAVSSGFTAVWSLPLVVGDATTGALNLYMRGGRPWDGPEASTARLLAVQAAIVLANAATVSDLVEANENLREALESRTVIGQAQGLLMARQNISEEAAFDILRRASQRTNRKLRDIATELVAGFQQHQPPGP